MPRCARSGGLMEVREVPTAEDLLSGVREGVEAMVRDALNEAERLRSEADETLQQYDATTGELARLRLEIHGLHHEAAEIPERINKARLDGLVPDSHGEDPEDLQRRYMAR